MRTLRFGKFAGSTKLSGTILDRAGASLRLMVKRILRKYKYPPDMADDAVQLVLQQAETLGEEWV
ncbi:MAG: DUF3387 domain-containing protein [Gammaproteobacteria bacterium]|nr:DUF3387 domain-containing protein [Gammaproteobacteria bacterium]MBU1557245.1 DUF3387 domain-containing protein [Gammaproteobacteria bacterium]